MLSGPSNTSTLENKNQRAETDPFVEDMWKTWPELRKALRGKKVILWGRSEDWVHKTTERLLEPAAYIVDSNPGYDGTEYRGLPVCLPGALEKEQRDSIYIVITGGVYDSIAGDLMNRGYVAGKDFCCSPAFGDFRLMNELHAYEQTIIVSCSDYDDPARKRYSKAGGGIYRYAIGPNAYEKVIPGKFRQVIRVGELFYAVEYVDMNVSVISKDLKVLDTFPLELPNHCGIAYHETRNALVIPNAATDKFSVYDAASFKKLDEIPFSEKSLRGDTQHHINDLTIVNDLLYVSYFSYSGNWKRGVMDGGVSEIDLSSSSPAPKPIVTDLWMPHSVEYLDGNLCYLDSMRGRFYVTTHTLAGEFPGFARGLAFDGRFYYIGQSEDMYMSRLFGVSHNIMLNAGFYLFDLETKVSRFYSMMDNMNIHDLLVL